MSSDHRTPANNHEPKSGNASGSSPARRSSLPIAGQALPPTKKLWRGEEELVGGPEVEQAARQEFPDGTDTMTDDVSRRGFVQLLGTSLAVTTTACYRPRQKIVPYVKRPPEVTPGNSLHFATSVNHEGFGFGALIESHEGRPTKLEGNPDHVDSLGAAGTKDQAYILSLYDNDRAKSARLNGHPADWRDVCGFVKTLVDAGAKNGGAGVRFLVEPSTSPLIGDLRARILAKLPAAKFVSYSGLADDAAVDGAKLAFGQPLDTRHDLTSAKVIVALDSDFMEEGIENIRLQRQFALGREPGENMNRLYVAEPTFTITGASADHRLRLRGSDIVALAQALTSELSKLLGRDVLGGLADLPLARAGVTVDPKWVQALAKDLARNRGRSVILVGRRQPAFVHALANAMNFALGNVGTTVKYVTPLRHDAYAGIEPLRALAEEIAAGKVETLFIAAQNPVFSAPSDFKFDKLLARVPNTLYWGLYDDETAKVVRTFVPAAHPLESWGDLRASDGSVSLVQPLIEPLWSAVTEVDFLAAVLEEGQVGSHEQLRAYWSKRAASENLLGTLGFELQWENWLGKGILADTKAPSAPAVSLDGAALAAALRPQLPSLAKEAGLELAFVLDSKVADGRHANNGWLQELPHPVTKITWDNAVLLSHATASRLSLKTADIVEVSLGDRKVRGPVYVQPGQAEESVTVALGYGRTAAGSVGTGVGFNANILRDSTNPWFTTGVQIEKVGKDYPFGITQTHWRMENREPAIAATVKEFEDHHSRVHHLLEEGREPLPQIHKPWDYSKEAYKWGMAIDLNKCTGCEACMTACQSENNIPIVGRENVRIGREMHWIRIDRYYETDAGYSDDFYKDMADPKVVVQPMACQHCETAPCEYVCPVNATVHSDEGLNEMVYNRCIGTRYCANNCPYKVRRFNYLDFHGDPPEVGKMRHNPDVTVRARGVMEKCTYCVQRIERARIDSRIEGRSIVDGEVKSACQQTCPTGAITFGSLHDPDSAVSKAHASERRYSVLHEINTRPRTVYLARVRNPNPELA
ncbi:MAG: TAT-variant-translocated molybdopterin oxidoreductase [Deltaproteobacteria bacterium]|nr:TAT-variant-translocated molybdopterin oxidoreductase [Deltaproteobacteria bacterium]